MAAPDNRVPRTYRKPAFIPDGYVDVLGALSIVGKALFGDKWTGEEIDARSPAQRPAEAEEQHRREDEARQRRDQAAQWLKQRAFAQKVSPKVITRFGTLHDVPESEWAAENAWQIFDRGTTGFAVADGYNFVQIEGHVLFLENELRSAVTAKAQTETATESELSPSQQAPGQIDTKDGLSQSARRKGGKRRKYNQALQDVVNRVRQQLSGDKKKLTLPTFKDWFQQHASYEETYSFEPLIPNCDDLYIEGAKLVWKDRDGRECDMALSSLDRYIRRANHPEGKG